MFPLNEDHKPTHACLEWAQDCLQQSVSTKALPAHAHQHKYHYTLQTEAGDTYLLVESKGNTGSVLKFIALSNRFRKNNLLTPSIFHQKITPQQSWMIISHFGHETLLDWLLANDSPKKKSILMQHCLRIIHQFSQQPLDYPVPKYDTQAICDDMVLAETFYLQKLLYTTQTQEESLQLSYIKNTILQVLSTTPKTVMHFDYHSANLMLVKAQSIAILDFQDCKIGPIGYDLMSLLTDHYFDHHEIEINEYIQYFYDHYVSSTHKNQITYTHFHYTCTLIAIQRHLKNLGIFSRLYFNGKEHYLNHIPRMIQKIKTLCKPYPHISTLPELLWSPQIKEKFIDILSQAHIPYGLEKTHQQAILATVET